MELIKSAITTLVMLIFLGIMIGMNLILLGFVIRGVFSV